MATNATLDGRGGAASASDVLSTLFEGPLGRGLAPAARAAKAWYAANGDRERRHTVGVWLQKSGREGVDPTMVVALDSNLLAGELGTNKDLYLQRLALHGVAVGNIRFTVGRAPTKGGASRGRSAKGGVSGARPELPELTESERARVERACADLPDGLKQSVSRAMCASLRRSKSSGTHKM